MIRAGWISRGEVPNSQIRLSDLAVLSISIVHYLDGSTNLITIVQLRGSILRKLCQAGRPLHRKVARDGVLLYITAWANLYHSFNPYTLLRAKNKQEYPNKF